MGRLNISRLAALDARPSSPPFLAFRFSSRGVDDGDPAGIQVSHPSVRRSQLMGLTSCAARVCREKEVLLASVRAVGRKWHTFVCAGRRHPTPITISNSSGCGCNGANLL